MPRRKMKVKLYVIDRSNNKKIYINASANSRRELAKKIGAKRFYVFGKPYTTKEVFAEQETNDPFVGTVIGGLIGTVFGGPFGVLGGAVLGGLLASGSNDTQSNLVDEFNSSSDEF